jgi:hypothetical protein
MAKKGPFELALAAALRAEKPSPGDAAIVALAKQYARSLDATKALVDVGGEGPMADLAAAATLAQLGPGLRLILVELGLTPKARAAILRGQPAAVPKPSGGLDELRARRQRREA